MTLTVFMLQPYQIKIEATPKGCIASIEKLGISASGESPSVAIRNLKEEKKRFFFECREKGKEIPFAERCNPVPLKR